MLASVILNGLWASLLFQSIHEKVNMSKLLTTILTNQWQSLKTVNQSSQRSKMKSRVFSNKFKILRKNMSAPQKMMLSTMLGRPKMQIRLRKGTE